MFGLNWKQILLYTLIPLIICVVIVVISVQGDKSKEDAEKQKENAEKETTNQIDEMKEEYKDLIGKVVPTMRETEQLLALEPSAATWLDRMNKEYGEKYGAMFLALYEMEQLPTEYDTELTRILKESMIVRQLGEQNVYESDIYFGDSHLRFETSHVQSTSGMTEVQNQFYVGFAHLLPKTANLTFTHEGKETKTTLFDGQILRIYAVAKQDMTVSDFDKALQKVQGDIDGKPLKPFAKVHTEQELAVYQKSGATHIEAYDLTYFPAIKGMWEISPKDMIITKGTPIALDFIYEGDMAANPIQLAWGGEVFKLLATEGEVFLQINP